MEQPKVSVFLQGKVEKESSAAQITPSAGATLAIDFHDAETRMSIDYRKPDSITLKLDGKIKVAEMHNLQLSASAGVAHEFFNKATTFVGTLEMEINKNIAVQIFGTKGSKDSSVGAGVTIRF